MKMGLALGAGAARGWTHIGIIQALESLGVKIDVVAGTSIGSYVGAAYCSGKLPELKEWAESLTEWQVLALMGMGLGKGGLASAHKVFEKFSEDFCAPTFEEMSKPFATLATDLYSGREVTFRHGKVGDSVRASCAIPALFSPVAHGEKWLVDGAVVNPVPVNLCRQMGADFVIAVNLSADFRPQRSASMSVKHEKVQQSTDDFFSKSKNVFGQLFSSDSKGDKDAKSPPSIISVMNNSLEILQARVTRSRLAGDPPDMLIEPQLENVGLMEFHRAEELIKVGEESIQRLAEQIHFQLISL